VRFIGTIMEPKISARRSRLSSIHSALFPLNQMAWKVSDQAPTFTEERNAATCIQLKTDGLQKPILEP
jgi:hypothetical protein